MTTDNDTSTKKLGELITDAVADIQVLIRKSIDLAVAELKESGRRALMSSLLLISAILLLIVSGLLLIIALAFGLAALGLPYWLAFVVDALVFVLVAAGLLWFAKSMAARSRPRRPRLMLLNLLSIASPKPLPSTTTASSDESPSH